MDSSTNTQLADGIDGVPDNQSRELGSEMLGVESTPEGKDTASSDLMQMLLAALKQQSIDNRDTTLAAIAEMRKPSAEDQAKFEEERAQLMAQTERRIEAAKISEADIAARKNGCGHTMPNGQTNFRGQVMSNGWATVFCSHCSTTYSFEATETERNQSGLNVDKWGPNAHTIIRNRVAACSSLVPPPIPRVPPGATIIFG